MTSAAKKTSYAVRRYSDGKEIGESRLTAAEFRHYKAMAQMPEGLIKLGELPHGYYDLEEQYQDTHEDTAVYLD